MSKSPKPAAQTSSLVDLFLKSCESKQIKRTGWGLQGIKDAESVAEHTFSLSFLTLQLAPILSDKLNYPLNINKLVKMAILHDFAEIETGDIVVARGANIDEKLRMKKEEKELSGIKKLFKATDKSNLSVNLFSEMLERESLEANIFWQLDKLDMAIQALFYEIHEKKNLSEFFENARANISNEFLSSLLDEVVARRKKS